MPRARGTLSNYAPLFNCQATLATCFALSESSLPIPSMCCFTRATQASPKVSRSEVCSLCAGQGSFEQAEETASPAAIASSTAAAWQPGEWRSCSPSSQPASNACNWTGPIPPCQKVEVGAGDNGTSTLLKSTFWSSGTGVPTATEQTTTRFSDCWTKRFWTQEGE